MFKMFKKFRSDERGAIAIIFAVALIPLILAAGISIDYGRSVIAKNKMQSALDAAVLAAGSADIENDDERKKMGKAVFEANFPSAADYGVDTNANDFITISGNTVTAKGSGKLSTTLMRLADDDDKVTDMNFGASSTATFPIIPELEIALVLDYSGSMGGEDDLGNKKYKSMAAAAQEFIITMKGILTDDGNKTDRIRIALAPLSTAMYGTFDMEDIRTDMQDAQENVSTNTTWTGCFGDRRGDYAQNDEPPNDTDVNEDSKFGEPPHNGRNPRAPDFCIDILEELPFQRLTDDFDSLGESLALDEDFRPAGSTHLSLGTAMGWHLVSPNAPFADGEAYSNNNVKKVVVLLTDGVQTVNGEGDGGYTVRQAKLNTEALCTGMKAEGILVVTVGYDLSKKVHSDALTRLEDCASEPSSMYFFNVNGTEDTIAKAFEDIAKAILGMVYVSK